jgi:hypothetical protein
MFQYVGLLELVCASCPMPTAEVLQDVSVIYARLGEWRDGEIKAMSTGLLELRAPPMGRF